MTPPDLAKCANCDCWFAAAAAEEVFHHATKRCRSDVAPSSHPREASTKRAS